MAKSAQEKADLKAEKIYEKKHRKKYRARPGDILFNMINYLVFTLFTVACIFPFYYLFINTISDNDLVVKGVINFIPRGLHLDNYKSLLNVSDLSNAFLVSLGRTIIGTAFMVAASAFVGYLVTKQEMWGRKFWYRFTIITMYFNAGLIPWYITMRNLHLTNNFLAYILPAIVQPFNIILVKTYMASISPALQEAAEIDGASVMKVFMKIMLPLAKPIMATIAIFAAVGQWNSFQDTLILMTKPALYTLQFLLYQYINQASSLAAMIKNGTVISTSSLATMQTPTSIRMTVSVVVILPILLVYPFFQKYFVKGIMIGSVKG